METDKNHFIYLDHNATTPVDPEAAALMTHVMEEEFGNPSSAYTLGKRAKEAIETHREKIAALMGARAGEIILTSGGSESNNMVLKGIIDFKDPGAFHIITSAVEHPAIINTAQYLKELGVEVTELPVDRDGRVDPDDVRKAVRPQTALITIMLANNETGTLQPIREISAMAGEKEIPFHTDAAQALGKIPVDVKDLGVDFLTVAGHKLYAPKGIGALYIREGLHLTPLVHGGGQEGGRRAGTENTILSVGLGAACQVAEKRLHEDFPEMMAMRDRFQELLFGELEGIVLNGHPEERLPNTLNISVPGVEGSRILDGLPAIMASTGAACHDRSIQLSHVLSAMGVPPEVGMGALRFSLGRSNTMDQIEEAAAMVVDRVKAVKGGFP
jgi:cysteine desulfurase